jgi:ferredoxin--NADP+ reductase
MTTVRREHVLKVHHWNNDLFSFMTTREQSFRFQSGQFATLGLEVSGRPLMRAYSMASAHYEDHLEFFSIKVPGGPLTSRLQHLKPGDEVLISGKPTGSLTIADLRPGKHLYLLCTGTGLAPFMSLIRDPDVYDRFEKIILVHGVRRVSELAYRDYICLALPNNEFLGDCVREKLLYYPTVTREQFHNQGRVTALIENGKLFDDLALDSLDPQNDRMMICGGQEMLKDVCALLGRRGFTISPGIGQQGDYVIERAFAGK